MSAAPAERPRPARMGETLVARGTITAAQLAIALKEQQRSGGKLGEVLINLGFASEEEIAAFLAFQAGVRRIDLRDVACDHALAGKLGESFCREKKLLPVSEQHGRLQVAMANTFDVLAVDEITRRTGLAVEVLAASEATVLDALDRAFGRDEAESLEALIQSAQRAAARVAEIDGLAEDRPIVRLVDRLLADAVRTGATDVHLEPDQTLVRCRYRVDGALSQAATLPRELKSAVAARIKVMAGLNISESRLPQDGKIVARILGRNINLRISTMPTVHGENIVVRVLDRNRLALGLGELGLSEPNVAALSEAIARESGMILVTGPTGSGKTTTLYAALAEINALERNIATLEDPVEYELPLIRQAQINPQAGLTFGVGLRALLRQDPDVILVGEMRDRETADVALRAAMTGHLVLSTLHTNSAAGAIPRLLEMGVEAYLLASTLVAVVAQRLLRKLCPHCAAPDPEPDRKELRALGLTVKDAQRLRRPVGCEQCGGSGYAGRRAVAEVLAVTPTVAGLIGVAEGRAGIAEAARSEGMVLMEEDARELVLRGETSLTEAVRHTWGGDYNRRPPMQLAG